MSKKALNMDCKIPYIKRLWNDCLNNLKLILGVMELNNLPLQLSIEDFMEDGNMIQLNIGVSKEGSVVMRKQWCVTFATMQLLVSSYFLYLLFVRWDDSK